MPDQHLSILLDIQKQLGNLDVKVANVAGETKVQSEMLKNMTKDLQDTSKMTKDHEKIINNWQGKIVVIGFIIGIVSTSIVGWLKTKLHI